MLRVIESDVAAHAQFLQALTKPELMANPEHLAILKKGVVAWNQWREDNASIDPELDHAELFHADLSRADLNGADLRGADLRHADLSDADLSRARLSHADLTRADLGRAFIQGADLSGANLSSATLNLADLGGANLTNANLSGADLARANLTVANLSGANVEGVWCWSTIFAHVFLGDVVGLEAVHHAGPSDIGLDTFFRSKGKIPENFLRGAGVPEDLIEHLASFHAAPSQFFSCFISYSHADKSFARRLHDTLQGRGIRCWLDEKQLVPGDHIHQVVDEAVRLWDKVLLCCSEKALTSWWVDKEVSKALKKEEQLWKERGKQVLAIIPLNLDGYLFDPNWQNWKKQHLTDRLAADFKGWESDTAKFEAQLQLVVKALRADDGAREKPPKSKL